MGSAASELERGEGCEVGLTAQQLLLAIRGHAGDDAPTVGDIADHLMPRHHSAAELISR